MSGKDHAPCVAPMRFTRAASLSCRQPSRTVISCSGGCAPLAVSACFHNREGIMKASWTLRSLLLAGTALGGLLASLLIVGNPAVESTAIAAGAAERQPVPLGPVC